MKIYEIILGVLLGMMVCTNRAIDEQLYVLSSNDGSGIEIHMSPEALKNRSEYMCNLFGAYEARGIEQRNDDGACIIDVPVDTFDDLQILETLLKQHPVTLSHTYWTSSLQDRLTIAGLSGQFGVRDMDEVIISYYKENPTKTIILGEGLSNEQEQSLTAMQRSGLAHIDTLLRGDAFFKRKLRVSTSSPKAHKAGKSVFSMDCYVWDKVEDVLNAGKLYFGLEEYEVEAKFHPFMKYDDQAIQYLNSKHYLVQIEELWISTTSDISIFTMGKSK